MNGSCCTGVVHDGIVEVFACSRWYHNGDYANTDYTNTGKSGAITHYTATIKNALNDNFTNKGVIVYAKATGENSASQDFHAPCIATKDNDMLLVYYDRIPPYTLENTNYYFVRGSLGSLSYPIKDDVTSLASTYSGTYIRKILNKQYINLLKKVNEIIINNNPDIGGDPENPAYFITDKCVLYYNFTDTSTHDTVNMSVTDKINKIVGNFVTGVPQTTIVSSFPSVYPNYIEDSSFLIQENTITKHFSTMDNGFTMEFIQYYENEPNVITRLLYANEEFSVMSNACYINYINTSNTQTRGSINIEQQGYSAGKFVESTATGVRHLVLVFYSNGEFSLFLNGKKYYTITVAEDFKQWDINNWAHNIWLRSTHRKFRLYEKALSDDEVNLNYKFEINDFE